MAEVEGLRLDEPVTAERAVRVWPHDAVLVQQALTNRCDDLDRLAKKLGEEGYSKESERVKRDAQVLREDVLPQLAAQGSLPFPRRALDDRVSSVVRRLVRRYELSQKNAEAKKEPAELDATWLIGTLSNWVTLAIEAAAAEGQSEGQRNRERTSAYIGQVALAAVRDPDGDV